MAEQWSTVSASEGEYRRTSVYGEDREDLTPQATYTAPLLSIPPYQQQPPASSHDKLQVEETPRVKAYSGPQLVSPPLSLAPPPAKEASPKPMAGNGPYYSPPDYLTCMFSTVSGNSNGEESPSHARPPMNNTRPPASDEYGLSEKQQVLSHTIDGLLNKKASLENECSTLERKLHELRDEEVKLNRHLQQLQQSISLADNVSSQKINPQELEERQKILDEKEFHIREKELEIRQKKMELDSEADSLFQRKKELDLREFDINASMPRTEETKARKLAQKEKELSIKQEELEKKEKRVYEENMRAQHNIEKAREMFAKAHQVSIEPRYGSGDRLTMSDQFHSINFEEQKRSPNGDGDGHHSSSQFSGEQGRHLTHGRSLDSEDPSDSNYNNDPLFKSFPGLSRSHQVDLKGHHYDGFRDHYDKSRDHYDGSRDHYDGSRDHYDKFRDQYDKSRDHYDKSRDHYDGSRDHRDKSRDHYDKSRDHYDKSRDHYNDGSRDDTRRRTSGPRNYNDAYYDDRDQKHSDQGYNRRDMKPSGDSHLYPSHLSGDGDKFHSQPSRNVASDIPAATGPSTLPNSTHNPDTNNDELFARMLQLQVNEEIREKDAQMAAEMNRPKRAGVPLSKEESDYHEQLAYQYQMNLLGYTCAPGTPEYEKALKEVKEALEMERQREEANKRDAELAKKLAYQKDTA